MGSDRLGRRAVLARFGSALSVATIVGCVGSSPQPSAGTSTTTTDTPGEETATPRPSESGGGTDRSTGTPTTAIHAGYDTTVVNVTTPDGTILGTVTAAIADTPALRYRGLSDTASLPPDRGMLFVFESVADSAFVMREMAFGIDIVYADADGVITRIHHAPGPNEDGNEQRYPGRGKYVLETVRGWTTERDVQLGDRLRFELE